MESEERENERWNLMGDERYGSGVLAVKQGGRGMTCLFAIDNGLNRYWVARHILKGKGLSRCCSRHRSSASSNCH